MPCPNFPGARCVPFRLASAAALLDVERTSEAKAALDAISPEAAADLADEVALMKAFVVLRAERRFVTPLTQARFEGLEARSRTTRRDGELEGCPGLIDRRVRPVDLVTSDEVRRLIGLLDAPPRDPKDIDVMTSSDRIALAADYEREFAAALVSGDLPTARDKLASARRIYGEASFEPGRKRAVFMAAVVFDDPRGEAELVERILAGESQVLLGELEAKGDARTTAEQRVWALLQLMRAPEATTTIVPRAGGVALYPELCTVDTR